MAIPLRICCFTNNPQLLVGVPHNPVWQLGSHNYHQRKKRIHATTTDENAQNNKGQEPDTNISKDDLAAKLAAAEAEAKALKRELASRDGREVDFSKMKPATPERRIDGVGYRETLFSTTENTLGWKENENGKWGLSEAELLSKNSEMEGTAVEDEKSKETVRRRLIVGSAITVLSIGLACIKFPTGFESASKPLILYLIPILRFREKLESIESTVSDVNFVRLQLKNILDSGDVSKETFLSAAGYLDGSDADQATSLTFTIFDYLNQADYNKYFDFIGQPSASQHILVGSGIAYGIVFPRGRNKIAESRGIAGIGLDFLKFSLKSIQAARENVDKFLSLIPKEELGAARSKITL